MRKCNKHSSENCFFYAAVKNIRSILHRRFNVKLVHYVNVSVLIKFSQKTSVFTLIIISSP